MQIILLSGGSGKRLWPLSNDARSKQFLKLLPSPDGGKESMIQRVVRQIKKAELTNDIVVATGANQLGVIENQLNGQLSIVTEPCRRDTFPAILLTCSYLADKGTSLDEPVIVMPCDSYTENAYFSVLKKMADAVERNDADIVLMGIEPIYPSAKYGYIIPDSEQSSNEVMPVKRFTEKPDVATAEKLISENALWNGGVFAFKLGYIMDLAKQMTVDNSYKELYKGYGNLTKISFDYAVVEKAKSVAVVPYSGKWKDLGTWNTLTDELEEHFHGNVVTDDSESSYVFNELEIPVVCIGAKDMVVAASPDGILVSYLRQSENLKNIVGNFHYKPMCEEQEWGDYKVINKTELKDGFTSITRLVTLKPNCPLSSYSQISHDKVWTFIDGEGEIILDGEYIKVKRGDTIKISKSQLYEIRSISSLTFIEVIQAANNVIVQNCQLPKI